MSSITIDWKYTKCFNELKTRTDPILIFVGGKRSGKSYAILQYLILKFLTGDKKKILITRKTLPSLRTTAYKTFVDLLKEVGAYKYVTHNKSFLEFTFKNNYLLCTSVDNEEKVRSTEWSDIFMEEATNFTYDDYVTLKLQRSAPKAPGEINRLIMALNPTDIHGFIKRELIDKQHVPVIHSTYLDNPFLDADYVKEMEALREQDATYWKIYGLGEFAEMDEIIYPPFILLDAFSDNFDERIFGLDFGYNNESALIKCEIKDKTNVYLTELLYESRLTNADLIGRLRNFDITPADYLYCDAAEPDRIEELRRAGFNAIAAYKGKNSVKDGIDFIKRLTIHTLPTNSNLNDERAGYKWRKDKEDKVYDEPCKWDDHLMDAMRYALYTHLANRIEPAIYVL